MPKTFIFYIPSCHAGPVRRGRYENNNNSIDTSENRVTMSVFCC